MAWLDVQVVIIHVYIVGQISDLLEPFDKLDENSNLALFTIDDKKVD